MNIQSFFQEVEIPSPLVMPLQSTILAVGVMLSFQDLSTVILSGSAEHKPVGAAYGYQVIIMLSHARPREIYGILWYPLSRAGSIFPTERMATCKTNQSPEDALKQIIEKRFGDCLIIDESGRSAGLLSLRQFMLAYQSKYVDIGMPASEAASPLLMVEGSLTLREALDFMLQHRVRRLILKVREKYYCCSERTIIKYLFSLRGLAQIRDNPSSSFATKLEKVVRSLPNEVPNVKGNMDVSQVWPIALSGGASCVVVDGSGIATPWDLVLKPYLKGLIHMEERFY